MKSNLTEGLTKKAPPRPDASMKIKGGSVNDGATRKEAAASPKTLGPRTA